MAKNLAKELFVQRHMKDIVFYNNTHRTQVEQYLRMKFEIKHR